MHSLLDSQPGIRSCHLLVPRRTALCEVVGVAHDARARNGNEPMLCSGSDLGR